MAHLRHPRGQEPRSSQRARPSRPEVNRLIRVSFGPFQLGELAEGAGRGGADARVCANNSASGSLALSGADFSAPLSPPPTAEENEDLEGNGGKSPHAADGMMRNATSRRNKNRSAPNQQAIPGGRLKKNVREKNCGGNFMAYAAKTRNIPSARSKRAVPATLTDRKGRPVPVERFGQPPARERARERQRAKPCRAKNAKAADMAAALLGSWFRAASAASAEPLDYALWWSMICSENWLPPRIKSGACFFRIML